jgi:gamma-glutamyl:cysteine ligase YbdK (ATP-grasp superfamily)
MTDIVTLVERSLAAETVDPFEDRVAAQADELRAAIAAGEFDNADFAVGLEVEVYAVDDAGGVRPLPETAFDGPANKELGVHNAELNTEPNVLDASGLASQADQIADRFERARADAREAGSDLVLDAMWTTPPAEGSASYLGSVTEREGVTVADHMRADPRYVAIDNDALRAAGGSIPFAVPGYATEFPTILYESLATSIQPHLQIPSAEAFPEYYNVAIRTMGPLLALSANSPFLPGDLYGDVADPAGLVDATHHELRIAAFEQSVNHTPHPKVRVPRDIEAATDVADRVVADDRYAPFLREWIEEGPREAFGDRYWEFDYKRSTYWRWLRCVIGGDPLPGDNDERSLRIEYRPLPTQPTIADVVGLQALTAGLLRGLVAADHPLTDLPWAAAEEGFYSAVEDGLDADLAWVSADGERTDDSESIFAEVFGFAREGLRESGLAGDAIDDYLAPIEARWEAGTTPSAWKKARVRQGLADGLDLPDAIEAMQREYARLSRETDSFAEWL